MTTTGARTAARGSVRRGVARLLGVLLVAGLVATAPPARAVDDAGPGAGGALASGQLTWGFKASWRTYTHAESTWSDGVTTNAAGEYQFPLVSSDFDAATGTTVARFGGTVHWRGHWYPKEAHLIDPPAGWEGSTELYVLDVLLRSPEVTIGPDGSTLTAEVVARDPGTWEVVDHGRIVMADLDPTGLVPEVADGRVGWTGLPAALPAYPAAEVFGDQYRAGQTLDPVSFAYLGEGGAPDLSEHWDDPGSLAVARGGTTVLVRDELTTWNGPWWSDPVRQVAHAAWTSVDSATGAATSYAQAVDLRTLQPLGAPTPVPATALGGIRVVDPSGQRVLYQSARAGIDSYVAWDAAAGTYRAGRLEQPVVLRANTTAIAWDDAGRRLLAVNRDVPEGVATTAYDQHRWFLNVWTETSAGGWTLERHPLPGASGVNENRWAYAVAGGAYVSGNAVVAADGSLLFKQLAFRPTGSTQQVATPVLRVRLVDGAARVEPVPGTAHLHTLGVLANGRGDVAVVEQGHPAFPAITSRVLGLTTDDDGTLSPVGDWVSLAPDEVDRFAIAPDDGTVWAQSSTAQKLYAVGDGRLLHAAHDPLLSNRGTELVLPGGGVVHALAGDGAPYAWDRPYAFGYGTWTVVGSVPTADVQPVPTTVRLPVGSETASATFTASASGDPAPTLQWQVRAPGSSRFVDLPGATGGTLRVDADAGDHGSVYRAVHANAAGRVASAEATLVVESAPRIAAQPVGATVTAGGDATFTVLATANPAPEVTWQRRVDGFWQDVPADSDELVVTSADGGSTLTVVGAAVDQSGAQLRARVGNTVGTVASSPARLTVVPQVTVPEEGLRLEGAVLTWSGSAELQAKPPSGAANYFSAGATDGSQGAYRAVDGDVSVLHVAADGSTVPATWATRAAPTAGAVQQVVRLGGGEAALEADGSAVVSWEGAWSVSFYDGLVPFTLSDPVLTVEPDGTGELTADLGGYAASQSDPTRKTPLEPVEDVTVATWAGVEVAPGGIVSVAPDYAGVEVDVPASGTPQDRTGEGWGAWPQGLVDFHVRTGLASYWYSSGGVADPKKAPAPFTVDLRDAEPVDPGEPGEPQPPAPGSIGVGSTLRVDPPYRYGRVGAPTSFVVFLGGHDGQRVAGTTYVSVRKVGTSRVTARVAAYAGWTTRMWSPPFTSAGSWQVTVTFVPTDPAYRSHTRSWWTWVTPTGRG